MASDYGIEEHMLWNTLIVTDDSDGVTQTVLIMQTNYKMESTNDPR